MSSGWKIGKIELPKAPNRIARKRVHVVQKIQTGIGTPWLFSRGRDAPTLTLEGYIFEGSKSLSVIEASYVDTIDKYLEKDLSYPSILLDDYTIDWVSHHTTIFESDSSDATKGDASIKVQFSDSAGKITRYFSSPRNYSKNDFVTIWSKIANGYKYKLAFYSASGDRSNGFIYYIQASNGAWHQDFIGLTSDDYDVYFDQVGTPSWEQIGMVEISPSSADDAGINVWLDALIVGVGLKLESPDGRYDGIYVVRDWETREEGGDIFSLKYRLNLYNTGDYYGEV